MNREVIGRLEKLEESTGVARYEGEIVFERMRCRYLLFLESRRRVRWEIKRVLRPIIKETGLCFWNELPEDERNDLKARNEWTGDELPEDALNNLIQNRLHELDLLHEPDDTDEPYKPHEMTEEEREKVRKFIRIHRAPCISLKSLAEAKAHLGEDPPERMLEDLKLLRRSKDRNFSYAGFLWERWFEEKYTPWAGAIESWIKGEDYVPVLELGIAKIKKEMAEAARKAAMEAEQDRITGRRTA